MRFKHRISKADPTKIAEGAFRVATGMKKEGFDDKMAICNTCEHKVEDPTFGGHACDICLCNLEMKLNTSDPCPENKF